MVYILLVFVHNYLMLDKMRFFAASGYLFLIQLVFKNNTSSDCPGSRDRKFGIAFPGGRGYNEYVPAHHILREEICVYEYF